MSSSVIASRPIARNRVLRLDGRLAKRVGALLQLFVVVAAFGAVALAVIPALLGYKGETVLSGSMQPMLHVGDVAYIKPVPARGVHVGQVVTFRVPTLHNAFVTHRVVAITGSGSSAVLTTKGDNNPVRDTFSTPMTRVVGVYAFTVPKLGKGLAWLHDRTSYIRIGAVIFLLVILHERRALLADHRRRAAGV
jgi:signal peptidase